MKEKKYKLTKETKNFLGIKLYRIEAIKGFGNVKKGELGGFIEKEDNLSHDGNCWVYGNAGVYGKAEVSGDARVYGKAWVYGDARVYGNAWVYGKYVYCYICQQKYFEEDFQNKKELVGK